MRHYFGGKSNGNTLHSMSQKQWKLYWKYYRIEQRVKSDPLKSQYTDIAIRPEQSEDFDELEMVTVDESSRRAAARAKRRMVQQV